MSVCWSGATVVCGCGSRDTEYVKDVDHDDGTCEVFRCLKCRKLIHIEMPD